MTLLEIFFYDNNGIDLNFSEIFDENDFQRVQSKKGSVFEGQESQKIDDDEKFVFEKLEYIVIEYQNPEGEFRRTEKIKQNFW